MRLRINLLSKGRLVGALLLPLLVTSQDSSSLPPCAQTCITNALGQAPSLGCSATDLSCLCGNANFGYLIRDCSNQACDAAAAAQAIAYVASLCATATILKSSSTSTASRATLTTSSSSRTSQSTASSSSSQSSGSAAPDSNNTHSGLSNGAKIGISVGVALGVIILLLGGCLLWRRKQKSAQAGAHGGEFATGYQDQSGRQPYQSPLLPEPVVAGRTAQPDPNYPHNLTTHQRAPSYNDLLSEKAANSAPIPVRNTSQHAPIPVRNTSQHAPIPVRTGSQHAPIPIAQDGLHDSGQRQQTGAALPHSLGSMEEEYARLEQRRSRLQELMRLDEESERLRRQIEASRETPGSRSELE